MYDAPDKYPKGTLDDKYLKTILSLFEVWELFFYVNLIYINSH